MKKTISCCLLFFLFILILSGCETEEPKMTQEEFRAEYIEQLQNLGVYVWPELSDTTIGIKEHFSDDFEIYSVELKLRLHVYDLINTIEKMPTYDEIVGLYFEYNEEIYARFNAFYSWYREGGVVDYTHYYSTLQSVVIKYRQTNEAEILGEYKPWNEYTFEDLMMIEEYIRNNPDYSETDERYWLLLEWLGVERPEEIPTE